MDTLTIPRDTKFPIRTTAFILILLAITVLPIFSDLPHARAVADSYPTSIAGCRAVSGSPSGYFTCDLKNSTQDIYWDPWSEFNRECTSYAAWMLSSVNGFTMPFNDDASGWGTDASNRHYTVDMNPKPGSIFWSISIDHVGWVESVSADGSQVTYEDYNYDLAGHWGERTVATSSASGYIHFKDLASGASTYGPASIQRPNGETDVVVVGPNNRLDYYYNIYGQGSWGYLPIAPAGSAYSRPAVVQRPNGETDVAVVGPNKELDFYYNFFGQGSWQKLVVSGSNAYSAPAMVQRPSTGETDIVASGANNSLIYYYNFYNQGTWQYLTIPYHGTGGSSNVAYGAPAVVQRSNGETDVVVQGASNSLDFYYNLYGQGGWGYLPIAGTNKAFSTPAMVQRPSTGETDVLVVGPNNALDYYYNFYNQANWAWLPVAGGNNAFSTPSVVQRSNGETDVVVQGASNSMTYYYNIYGQGGWGSLPIPSSGATNIALSSPSVVQRPSTGETDVIVDGNSNSLQYYYNFFGQGSWSNLQVAGASTAY